DDVAAASGRDRLAVGGEGDGLDRLVVSSGDEFAAVSEVPDFDGTVGGRRRQPPAVGAERERLDLAPVSQPRVAEDAGDVRREVAGQGGQVPAGVAERLGGLVELA